ncbi:cell envelope integrity protein TolA, partial [Acinetobacter sichuanensis]
MPLPDKSTLIGANVTEQGFKTALGEFVDNASSKEDAKSKADAAQANAISAAAIDAKSKADAAQANAISAAAIDAKSKADAAQANAISAAATDAK